MPRGGARKGAGRKPKPLAEKLAAGNPGHRPLKKVEFNGRYRPEPPSYLSLLQKPIHGIPTPIEIFEETVAFLEPSDCLNLIPSALIADYSMAKYYLINAQHELSKTATVAYNGKRELVVTGFTEAMLKMQKNVIQTWTPIWDIVSRNSERLMANPEEDLIMTIMSGRVRKKRPKGEADYGGYEYTESSGGDAESSGI